MERFGPDHSLFQFPLLSPLSPTPSLEIQSLKQKSSNDFVAAEVENMVLENASKLGKDLLFQHTRTNENLSLVREDSGRFLKIPPKNVGGSGLKVLENLVNAGFYALEKHEASGAFSCGYLASNGCLHEILHFFDVAGVT
jgi:hypothetical protein